MAEKVTLLDLKKFFGYESSAAFSADWKQLSKEGQQELLSLLQIEADAGRYIRA